MEIKQFDGSPLDRLRTEGKQRSVSPMQSRQQKPGNQLNSRQMFATALRRTDISPAGGKGEGGGRVEQEVLQTTGKGWSKTTTYENVEKLIQEADSLKSQMQLRSDLNRRETRTGFSGSNRHSADKPSSSEFLEVTNLDPPLKTLIAKHLTDEAISSKENYYKDLYEKAIAQHAAEKQKWICEKEELLRRIESLTAPKSPLPSRPPPPSDSPHQVYLLKINREIEELKDRVRRTEQQNETIRSRAKTGKS